MRWAGNLARMGKSRNAYRILVVKLKARDDLQDLRLEESIILNILK
jgi:hypothetical protein